MSLSREVLGRQLPTPPREDLIAVAALAAFAVALFPDAILRGRVFFERDIHRYWVQQAEAFVRDIAAGSWPLWNPWISFGEPLLANPTAQVLYPTTWLHLLMPPWRVYTVAVASHALLAGTGLYALARSLGASRPAALAGSAAWMSSGPLLSLVNMLNQFTGAAWLPWAVLAGRATLAKGGVGWAFLMGATLAATVLAGSPETGVMAGATIAAFALAERAWRGPRPARRWAAAGLGLALAVALSAAQWLPTLELARGSSRGALPREVRVHHSLPPLGLAQVVAPWFPRGQSLDPGLAELSAPLLYSVHLGPLVLLLGLAAPRGRHPQLAWALIALLLGAVLVSLGDHLPVYDLLVAALPPLKLLRYPVKAMVLASFSAALLVALGLDAWRQRGARWRPAPIVVAALAAAELFAVHRSLNQTASAELLAVRPPLLDAVRQQDGSRLFSRGRSAGAAVDPARWRSRVDELRLSPSVAVALDLRSGLIAPVAGEWGVFGSFEPDINGVQPLPLSRLSRLVPALEGEPGYLRLLRLGAVGQLIARDEGGLQDLQRTASLESPLGDSLLVFSVPRSLPRAYAVGAVRAADGDAALTALLDPGFDPTAEVLLPEAPGPHEAAAPSFQGSVHIAGLEPDEVRLDAELSHPGYVVLVDTFAPGWKADVDGAAAELRRANVAFRAVGVPAGRHRVTFRYRPRPVVAGLALSGAAAFSGMALGLARLFRRPSPA